LADAPLIDAEILFRQPEPALNTEKLASDTEMKIIGYAAPKVNDFLSDLIGIRIRRDRDEWQGYDKHHEQEALTATQTIEKFNCQKLLPRQKQLADDYAIQVLGKKVYAPWLYVYTLVSGGSFKEGWIPDNFFGKLVVPKINKLRQITHFKTFSNVALKTESIPDVAYYIDGVFYTREFKVIDVTFLREIIGDTSKNVFVKKDESGRGKGVFKLVLGDINEDTFKRIGDCVVQLPIQQHEFFEHIISGSVATVRITTVKNNDGKIDLRASYLRLGRGNTAWVQSDNSVRVAIVDRNGELDTFGYTENWRRWLSHPDSNFSFYKQRVPQFKEAVEYCLKLHALVPHFAIIGWDIAISYDDKVKLLEWNGDHCDIKFSEATTGPCFTGLNWERLK
jgi:hypothetical protein